MIRRLVFGPLSSLVITLAFSLSLSSAVRIPHSGQHRRPRVSQEIDEHRRVRLHGNTRPEARAENDRGRLPDHFPLDHMLLQLKRSPEQEQELVALIDQLHTKGSPNFHQWLTAEEFGNRFGVADADIAKVTDWLESHGFAVNLVYPSSMVIDFSGTTGQVRDAFGTEIHRVEVNGARHIANMSDPEIPAALAPVVVGIVSLHDFMPHPMHKARSQYTVSAGTHLIVPADIATIYNLNPLFSVGLSGQGQTIVVIEDTDVFSTADWTTFRSTFGLSVYSSGSFSQVHPPPPSGPNNCTAPGVNADDAEAILDAEYASAAAPDAAIELAACANSSTFGGLIALQNILNASGSPPAVISISYGECEAFNGATPNAAYNSAYQQAVTEGVSIFVSSGDEGAASCDANATRAQHGIGVSGFASTPYNVAIGGTDFGDTVTNTASTYWNTSNLPNFGSAKSYIPEIPWNDSCASVLLASFHGFAQTYGTTGYCNSGGPLSTASGSGGPSGCATGTPSTSGVVDGTCAGYAKPSWQSGLFGNPSDGVRDIPDVSLFAANGIWGHYYVVCYSDIARGGASCAGAPSTWSGFGGTSISSPIMAGIQALVNQKWGRQGNPNPVYYAIAAEEFGASGNANCNSSNVPAPRRGLATTCVFYDVTQGDMDVNCRALLGVLHDCYLPSGTNGVLSTSNGSYQPAFGTTSGWDFSTGIGSVNAYNLVFDSHW